MGDIDAMRNLSFSLGLGSVVANSITTTDLPEGKRVSVIKERSSNCCVKASKASQLRMGITHEREGKINDALAIYLGIIARYPESEERQVAEVRLLRLARAVFEESGRIHPAIVVYERLEGVF